jgi:hypothetical protein
MWERLMLIGDMRVSTGEQISTFSATAWSEPAARRSMGRLL